jgi:hypothetical protein
MIDLLAYKEIAPAAGSADAGNANCGKFTGKGKFGAAAAQRSISGG